MKIRNRAVLGATLGALALAGAVLLAPLPAPLAAVDSAVPTPTSTPAAPPTGYEAWPRPIDGHAPCYVKVGPTSRVWCADGYRTTS